MKDFPTFDDLIQETLVWDIIGCFVSGLISLRELYLLDVCGDSNYIWVDKNLFLVLQEGSSSASYLSVFTKDCLICGKFVVNFVFWESLSWMVMREILFFTRGYSTSLISSLLSCKLELRFSYICIILWGLSSNVYSPIESKFWLKVSLTFVFKV